MTAHRNVFATFDNLRDPWSNLLAVKDMFARLETAELSPNFELPGSLFLQSFAAFHAAVQTAASGFQGPTYVMTRSVLEHSLWGYHFARCPWDEGIWLARNDSDAARKRDRKTFQPTNLLMRLREQDEHAATEWRQLYDRCIDEGGHPTARSLQHARDEFPIESGKRVIIRILSDKPEKIADCVGIVVRAGIVSGRLLLLALKSVIDARNGSTEAAAG